MKIICNWLFINRLWHDAEPCSVAINLNNVTQITEEWNSKFGTHIVIHTNDHKSIPIEGNLIDILAELQNYLSNY